MAKQVIWSLKAQYDRKQIIAYWRQRNRSNTYSRKLNQLFKDSIQILSQFPQIGKTTDEPDITIKVVKDYLVIYEETALKY